MHTDFYDHKRLGIPYIEKCEKCGGQKVTTWSDNGQMTTQTHTKTCPVLKELRIKYQR